MLPPLFVERLRRIIPQEHIASVEETFGRKKSAVVRWNTLKGDRQEFVEFLQRKGIGVHTPSWYDLAFILDGIETTEVSHWELSEQGKIYIQSLPSMLPVVVLGPQPGETILDLCAAPGSKTTQMAAHMRNQGKIIAVESVRDRLYRLKSVIQILGAEIIEPKCLDGRRFRLSPLQERGNGLNPAPGAGDGSLFDRILVDAPCSSEGRFKTYDKKSVGYWSLRKIREMVHKQRGLLLNACRMLKPGGVLVYSTCTFAPEENEGVVSWVLRKMEGEVALEAIDLPGVERYPSILDWGEKPYDPQTVHCFRVLPNALMEGFFIAKFVRR